MTISDATTRPAAAASPNVPSAAALMTAAKFAALLEAAETPAVMRETLYHYTIMSLWFHYVDDLKPRIRRPPKGNKALAAWVRLHLPTFLTRAAADELHYTQTPTLITFD